MKTKDAIKHLTTQLKKDEGYRLSWQANIAMAFKDNWGWYEKKTGKRYMNRKDKHIIANDAANYFLDLLCK